MTTNLPADTSITYAVLLFVLAGMAYAIIVGLVEEWLRRNETENDNNG